MSLTIIDDTEVEALGPTDDGTYTGAKGGTEMMADRIKGLITEMGIEDKINVIHSRVRNVDTSKRNLLVLHDLFNDPEVSPPKGCRQQESVRQADIRQQPTDADL